MLYITKDGHVDAEKIKLRIISNIERGEMNVIHGIVVHQTGGPSADSAFNSYKLPGANGAHFLIEKDGTIYQTASVFKVTNHVGYLQSRCVITQKCSPTELQHAQSLERTKGIRKRSEAIQANEKAKPWPQRFPSNADAIGIELVGIAKGPQGAEVYEQVTDQQNASLKWLVKELSETLNVSMQEVYRHPQVGRKNETETSTAKW